MNKFVSTATLAGLALVAATALGACAAPAAAEPPPPTASAAAEVKSTAAIVEDTKFVAYVRANTTVLEASTDESLINLGRSTCAALNTGSQPEELVQAVIDTTTDGTKRHDLETAIGAGVGTYCPAHLADIEAATK